VEVTLEPFQMAHKNVSDSLLMYVKSWNIHVSTNALSARKYIESAKEEHKIEDNKK
jgi:hypothetical protein